MDQLRSMESIQKIHSIDFVEIINVRCMVGFKKKDVVLLQVKKKRDLNLASIIKFGPLFNN